MRNPLASTVISLTSGYDFFMVETASAMVILSKSPARYGCTFWITGSNASITPVTEASAINKKEDTANAKWLYLHIEIVINKLSIRNETHVADITCSFCFPG